MCVLGGKEGTLVSCHTTLQPDCLLSNRPHYAVILLLHMQSPLSSGAASKTAERLVVRLVPARVSGLSGVVMCKGACMLQISGHVTDEEGKKRIALTGMWNSYLDMQKCDEEGTPLPGSELVRLWTVGVHTHPPFLQKHDHFRYDCIVYVACACVM